MERETIKTYIKDNQEIIKHKAFFRRELKIDYEFIKSTGKIAVILGPRRAGKSFFLFQIRKDLNFPVEKTVWIDFSTWPFDEFTENDWGSLWALALEFTKGDTPLFLIDEIQELKNFEKGLMYLLQQGGIIFVSGSNSTIFERELASLLRGKMLYYHLFPLSFKEFLIFKGESTKPPQTTKEISLKKILLEEYLEWGGFPEVVIATEETLKYNLLSSYIEIMLFRDVVDRHGITNVSLLDLILKKAIKSFTKEISIHKWFNDLKSQGRSISKSSVYNYLDYLIETYYLISIKHYNPNSHSHSQKIYLVDNGIYKISKIQQDTGKLLENLVAIDLLRISRSLHFWKSNDGEIDFVNEKECIQVTTEISPNNKEREEKFLKSHFSELKGKKKKIVTFESYVRKLGV